MAVVLQRRPCRGASALVSPSLIVHPGERHGPALASPGQRAPSSSLGILSRAHHTWSSLCSASARTASADAPLAARRAGLRHVLRDHASLDFSVGAAARHTLASRCGATRRLRPTRAIEHVAAPAPALAAGARPRSRTAGIAQRRVQGGWRRADGGRGGGGARQEVICGMGQAGTTGRCRVGRSPRT